MFQRLSKKYLLPVAVGLCCFVCAGNANVATAQDFFAAESEESKTQIKNIKINGAQRIDPETVLSYITVKPGEYFTPGALSESLKSLYATGLFSDVSIKENRGELVVNVVENPLLNIVAFEGNKRIEDSELTSETLSRARTVLSRSRVQSDVDRIYELYRRNGRFSVTVDPKIIKLDQNRVNLVYEIDEGPETEIRSIKFVGNEAFDDDDLSSVVTSKEARWYRFITSDDRYDPDRLAFDQEMLRRFYLKNGYVDFRILSAVAELSQDKEAFFITFTVEEGERYKVGSIRIDASAAPKDINLDALNPLLTLEKGDWYDADVVDEIIDSLVNKLGDMQYAFVNIRPDLRRNPSNQSVDITLRIAETSRVFVEKVNVDGNVRTLDKVVRREFELIEGDPFNRTKLANTEKNINALGFFESVKIQPNRGSNPDQTVIDVEVQEKSTGEVSIGAGFSTNDGPLADLRIRERNLLGKGQDLLFSTTIAGERTQFEVAFTEPYFLDRKLSAGVDLFHMTRDLQSESSYDQQKTGGGLRLGFPLSDKIKQTLNYKLLDNRIENVQSDASRFISDQEGKRITSSISQRLTYDDRDNALFPTTGPYAWFDAEVAGLGGDAKYVSGKLGGIYYFPVYKDVVLSTLAEGGAIEGWNDEDVEINDRFFLGGNNLRGFEYAGVGPRDLSTDDSLGGNVFYRGSVEVEFPVGLPEELGIKGHAFSDVGSLWSIDSTGASLADDSSIRASAGLGVSWKSPMGPVRVDYATPLADEDYDEIERLRFSFGTRF